MSSATRTARTSRSPSATPTAPSRSRPARRQLASHDLRPVERSAGGRPVDAGRLGAQSELPGADQRPRLQLGRHRRHAVADEPLHPDLHRRQQGRRLAEPTRPEFRSPTSRCVCATAACENLLVTDFTGTANFNETFPLFSWYVVETDVTRYKNTGTHVVYDAGGPADGIASVRHRAQRRLSAVRHLDDRQVPGEHRRAGLGADESARAGRGVLRRRGLHRQVDSRTGRPAAAIRPAICTTSTHAALVTDLHDHLSTGRIDPPWVGGSRAGRASPARTTSSNSARSPMRRRERRHQGPRGLCLDASVR